MTVTTPIVLRYLQDNPERDLWVEEICAQTGLNRKQVQDSLRKIVRAGMDRGALQAVFAGHVVRWHPPTEPPASNGYRPAAEPPPMPPFPIGLVLEVRFTAGDTHIAEGDDGQHYRITLEPL